MFISADDFRIRAYNFDLTKGWNILRIICGAFMFPHVAGKFAAGAIFRRHSRLPAKAGFNPPELWVYLAAAAETLTGVTPVVGTLQDGREGRLASALSTTAFPLEDLRPCVP
jgi:putative oxidoreductase